MGHPIGPTERVRIVAPDFLTSGGSGFSVFGEATDPKVEGPDLDILLRYFGFECPPDPGRKANPFGHLWEPTAV